MPRTKVSRNSKRNRGAAVREEKIREFDSALDQFLISFDMKIKQNMMDIDTEIVMMKSRIPQRVLEMKLVELMKMNVAKFSEIKTNPKNQRSLQNQTSFLPSMKKSKDDEGYITEDSRGSAIDTGLARLSQMQAFASTARMPGPLSSAKARKPRRSRSACGYPSTALTPKPSSSGGHTARQKLRTSMISRQKAISADRTLDLRKGLPSSPTALLRWPKPGEMVISMTGSPIVAQVMPDQFANVNIPIRDGVLSLRPKRLQRLDPELVHKIDQETLSQIKLLQSNLDLIMSYADKTEK